MKRQVPIVVQNFPVPFDRRVRLESRAFASAAIRRRSGKPASDVTVVRTDPDPRDEVDIPARAANIAVHELGRDDIAKMGPARVERHLAWPHQERACFGVYRCLVSLGKARERTKA